LNWVGQPWLAWRQMAVTQQDIVLLSKSLQITSSNAYFEPQLGVEGWEAFGADPPPDGFGRNTALGCRFGRR
jgi:hypothetical protein